ncbi:hypothetical protein NTE_03066 [Candidatus Nitrososphaera evergladensis SR1]|uniref:Uncharacterized protein n=1 Tax=Candidatus Nitrososphaera evergladensis SR1 TaxID=1459636 RepID=A0A075MV31_9ARCH|nr:hypothetical protein [Candidatus Nitrososphaera evergladensis]AIF85100.1 hypothetical protein NTE_03066 [Candidatus Nitrososphaera evergladensis SR1]
MHKDSEIEIVGSNFSVGQVLAIVKAHNGGVSMVQIRRRFKVSPKALRIMLTEAGSK